MFNDQKVKTFMTVVNHLSKGSFLWQLWYNDVGVNKKQLCMVCMVVIQCCSLDKTKG